MKVKIVSDGIHYNTKVIDIETGKEIEHVRNIHINMQMGDFNKADIEVLNIPVDIIAEAEIKKVELEDNNPEIGFDCKYCKTPVHMYDHAQERIEDGQYVYICPSCMKKEHDGEFLHKDIKV